MEVKNCYSKRTWIAVLALVAEFFFTGTAAPDNSGREFIIGFMDNLIYPKSLSWYASGKLLGNQLFITTSSKSNVVVQVTAPRCNHVLNETFSLRAGEVKQLTISRDFRLSGTEMNEKGILIKATDDIVIYGINKETYSNDGFLGLPTDVLGKEYFAASYGPATMYCLILIIGIHDDTEVNIKLSGNQDVSVTYNGVTYYKEQSMIVKINRYTTFQIKSRGDLTGTYISANKIISVLSGNKKTKIGSGKSQDHLVEQLISVDKWGKRYIAVPIPERAAGDTYRFIASESDTNIKIWGQRGRHLEVNEQAKLSVPGSWTEKSYSADIYLYIEASKPILVVQYVLSQLNTGYSTDIGDPSMILLPPVEQYDADYTFTTPKYSLGSYYNYFLFVVKEGEENGLRVNGKPVPTTTTYTKVPNTNYVGGFIKIPEGTYQCKHTNPTSVFGAVLFGRQYMESYGFPAGLRLSPINKPCIQTAMIPGDGYDNDCDGLIDEEICYDQWQNQDEDTDGLTDEDCVKYPPGQNKKPTHINSTVNTKTTTDMMSAADVSTHSSKPNSKDVSTKINNNVHMVQKTAYVTDDELTSSLIYNTVAVSYNGIDNTIIQDSTTTQNSNSRHNAKESGKVTTENAGNLYQYEELNDDELQEIFVFPEWIRRLEVGILSVTIMIMAGMITCACRRLCLTGGRRNNEEEEEEKHFVWREKNRPLPRKKHIHSSN